MRWRDDIENDTICELHTEFVLNEAGKQLYRVEVFTWLPGSDEPDVRHMLSLKRTFYNLTLPIAERTTLYHNDSYRFMVMSTFWVSRRVYQQLHLQLTGSEAE